LVGTPETVAEAMLEYFKLGATSLLIRGYDPRPDAIQYGEELIPRVRELVANYEAASVTIRVSRQPVELFVAGDIFAAGPRRRSPNIGDGASTRCGRCIGDAAVCLAG
jgi:hypothetical protein